MSTGGHLGKFDMPKEGDIVRAKNEKYTIGFPRRRRFDTSRRNPGTSVAKPTARQITSGACFEFAKNVDIMAVDVDN